MIEILIHDKETQQILMLLPLCEIDNDYINNLFDEIIAKNGHTYIQDNIRIKIIDSLNEVTYQEIIDTAKKLKGKL